MGIYHNLRVEIYGLRDYKFLVSFLYLGGCPDEQDSSDYTAFWQLDDF